MRSRLEAVIAKGFFLEHLDSSGGSSTALESELTGN